MVYTVNELTSANWRIIEANASTPKVTSIIFFLQLTTLKSAFAFASLFIALVIFKMLDLCLIETSLYTINKAIALLYVTSWCHDKCERALLWKANAP